MKIKEAMFRIAGLICLVTFVSLDAFAQADSTLDQAYDLLVRQENQLAAKAANAYLAKNPRRYRAEFIVAVAECRLHKGRQDAMQRMAALKRDYVLTSEAQLEVDSWISFCAPPKPEPHETGEAGVAIAALTSAPQIKSAAANKPNERPLPLMSALVFGTSYSGDDYTELKSVQTADDCSRACRLQAPCRSMTYAKSSKTCWLKKSVPPAEYGEDFVSATKRVN